MISLRASDAVGSPPYHDNPVRAAVRSGEDTRLKGRGSASNYSSGWTVSVKLGKVLRLSSRLILSQKVCAGRSRTNAPTPGYNIQPLFRILPQHTVALRCAKIAGTSSKRVFTRESRFSGGASTVKGGEIFGHVVARVNENACDRCRLEPLAGVSVEGAMRRGTAARADRGGLPALLRAVAHSVHLQNMNAVSEAVQQGSG